MIRPGQQRSGTAPAILPVVQRSGKGHLVALLESRGEQVLLLGFPYQQNGSGGVDYGKLWDGTARRFTLPATRFNCYGSGCRHFPGSVAALFCLRLRLPDSVRCGSR